MRRRAEEHAQQQGRQQQPVVGAAAAIAAPFAGELAAAGGRLRRTHMTRGASPLQERALLANRFQGESFASRARPYTIDGFPAGAEMTRKMHQRPTVIPPNAGNQRKCADQGPPGFHLLSPAQNGHIGLMKKRSSQPGWLALAKAPVPE
ncbi:hypothetical protein D9M70_556370 [compost metagenome]